MLSFFLERYGLTVQALYTGCPHRPVHWPPSGLNGGSVAVRVLVKGDQADDVALIVGRALAGAESR
ncbi:MAG: hypothetical protein OEY56_09425 [Cyclobacteriaceae bacterium]|nr:hypothetical protein [Cyclobacteriaceae bacterium]